MKNKFKTMTLQELTVKLEDLKKEFFDLRFQMVIGHVENPLQKRNLRKDIARVNTMIRAHELAEAAKKE